ncbi:hypothetical protein DdX_22295 [Ditylenchus destructor]|uniref:Uncharacterized protein n=1 Tax=Ditylenchus destructor TaxID=166010 RepID=A0AAD4MEJ6_9BILA|nr:hypothetical protein DdX_22295 [Ditylenchus destructor]
MDSSNDRVIYYRWTRGKAEILNENQIQKLLVDFFKKIVEGCGFEEPMSVGNSSNDHICVVANNNCCTKIRFNPKCAKYFPQDVLDKLNDNEEKRNYVKCLRLLVRNAVEASGGKKQRKKTRDYNDERFTALMLIEAVLYYRRWSLDDWIRNCPA